MTEQEGNKLIAVFEGYKLQDKVKDITYMLYIKQKKQKVISEFNYHSSWDELIPVIKICKQKLKSTEPILGTHSKGHVLMANINNELYRLSLIDAHDCVCKFIQWYNNIHKTHHHDSR